LSPHRPHPSRPSRSVFFGLSLLVWVCHSLACKRSDPPQPDSSRAASAASAAAAAVVSPSAVPSAVPSEAPSARRKAEGPVPARLESRGGKPEDSFSSLFGIDGALMVTDGRKVGRLDGDHVEWIGKIPSTGDGVVEGQQTVNEVHGVWPDRVDAFTSNTGRAHFPAFYPIKGGGAATSIGVAGQNGMIHGIAYTAESTLLAYSKDHEEYLLSVRGAKHFYPRKGGKDAGCEVDVTIAVRPVSFIATRGGQVVSVGKLCGKQLVAEVWDAPAKSSRIVEIPRTADVAYGYALLRGAGARELWFFAGKSDHVLHYEDGTFTPTAALGATIQSVFVSQEGQLHAFDGQVIHRLEEKRWVPLFKFLWPAEFYRFAAQGDTIWCGASRLVPDASSELTEGCADPFVDLYKVSDSATASFNFPSTRKALSSFAEVDQLRLVEFHGGNMRRLGVIARSKAQAEALAAHVKATMKDEKPRLMCFKPESARVIEITKK